MSDTTSVEVFGKAKQPWIWESVTGSDELNKVRPYDLEYRRQIEGDIAQASVDFINRQANAEQPFFLYISWSQVHYPAWPHPDFAGKSGSGPFGDSVMELDHRTGQVLDAIADAGIEDNTIVIWLSDNGPAQTRASNADFMGSSPGPFRGEVGDALEGSLRVPGMVKWPDRIPAHKGNEMVSIHDFLPTLANIIGAQVPDDRPIDGVDQSGFFLVQSEQSARESLITFIEGKIAAVRFREWRIYPRKFIASAGNPSAMGLSAHRVDGSGFPAIFNIERDPREQWNVVGVEGWVLGEYLRVTGEYLATLKRHPNPPRFSMTKFEE